MSEEIIVVELAEQPIELCKLLKAANLVGGGGEAKMVISEGYVLVNNEVEYQKRKKIFHQDIVEFNGEQILVECFAPIIIKEKKPKPVATPAKTNRKRNERASDKKASPEVNKASQQVQSHKSDNPKGKRKPINF